MPAKKLVSKDGQTILQVKVDEAELKSIKEKIVNKLGQSVKVAGFREGKAPSSLVEKQIDQRVLSNEFIDAALSSSYEAAIKELDLKPMTAPAVTIKKFVPFTQLEYEVTLLALSDIKLTDYTKIKLSEPSIKITDKEIEDVIENLRIRNGERKEVERPAKTGDEIVIDFNGKDHAGKPVNGADGKNYPLLLGSGTFIKGFEENLTGLKTNEEKTFTLTFPKDYGIKALANRKVNFSAKVNKVFELILPEANNEFAAKLGPFKKIDELKEDVKKQLLNEKNYRASKDLESQIVRQIISKSQIPMPKIMLDEQVEHLLKDLRQNLVYRGQTLDEFLESEGITEKQYREKNLAPQAEERIKGGLALSAIAEKEKIFVTPEELETRIQLLKGQYQDQAMQAELDKPENRREVFSRLVTEKTLHKLLHYAIPDHDHLDKPA